MFLNVKPRPPVINTFFTQSGKLGDTSAGFTQSLFFGDNFIDLTGVFLVNADLKIPFTVNHQYTLVASGNSYDNLTGNFSGYFYSGCTGSYHTGPLVSNSFYPTGLISGDFNYSAPNFDVSFVELTDVESGSFYIFTGSGWVASGSISQNLTSVKREETNLLKLKSINFLKFCEDTLSGTGILTGEVNAPLAFASGIQKLTVDANSYYPGCSTGAFEVDLFNLRQALTGISGSSCCGFHAYDIYPSGGDTGNFVFIKYDGLNQTFTGYSGETTGFDSGLLFPNLISEFISDLSGRIDFYFTGGHISCPPSRISGLSTGFTGIFAQIEIRDGDFFGENSFACFPTGQVAISGYTIFADINCESGCIETGQFSPGNCVLYNKNTLSFVTPRGIKPGNYDVRVENEFGNATANGVIKLLAPPADIKIQGVEFCDFKQLPSSFLIGEWVKDYALTDEAGAKYFTSPGGNIYVDQFKIATGDYSVMNVEDPYDLVYEDAIPSIGFGALACNRQYYGEAHRGVLGVHFRRLTVPEVSFFGMDVCYRDSVADAQNVVAVSFLLHPNYRYHSISGPTIPGEEFETQFVRADQIRAHGIHGKRFFAPYTFTYLNTHIYFSDICHLKPMNPENPGASDPDYFPAENLFDCREIKEEVVIPNPTNDGFAADGYLWGWDSIGGATAGATGLNYKTVKFLITSGIDLPCGYSGENLSPNEYVSHAPTIAFLYHDRFGPELGTSLTGDVYLNAFVSDVSPTLGLSSSLYYPIKDSTRVIGVVNRGIMQNASIVPGNDLISYHSGC